jgi:hypothetical protein
MRKPGHSFASFPWAFDFEQDLIGRQFRGPPNSGNGGYVCGVLAKGLDGPVTPCCAPAAAGCRPRPGERDGVTC